MNRRWKVETPELPRLSLKNNEEICEFLEETINRVRQGAIDLRTANSLGFLAGVQLKALAQRVEAPEARCNEESVYLSLFQRLGSAAPEQEVFDLYPQPQELDQTSALARLPAPSEISNDPPSRSHDPSGIITVEVE